MRAWPFGEKPYDTTSAILTMSISDKNLLPARPPVLSAARVSRGRLGRRGGGGCRGFRGCDRGRAVTSRWPLAVGGHDLAAQGAQGNAGFGDCFDLGECGRLRPGEGVEHGVGGVAEASRERGALRGEPSPVEAGLKNAEGVIVGADDTHIQSAFVLRR